MMRRLLLALIFLLLLAAPALAQEGDPADALQKDLWCPICQGIRLDVCDQKVCEQMREMIDQELAAGNSPEQIKAQFIELYGPVVLGEPPRQGFYLTAWILPILLLVAGLAVVVWLTRRWVQKPATAPAAIATAAASPETAPDPYLARVEKELQDL